MEKLFNDADIPLIKSPPFPERVGTSNRGIQSLVSKINPRILKSVMEAGESGAEISNLSFSASEVAAGKLPWSLPVLDPNCRSASSVLPESPTLTIFYDGTVVTLNLPRAEAEAVINTVESLTARKPEGGLQPTLAEFNRADLPIMRRKSLYRFLEKRKQRLQASAPYDKGTITTDSC